MTERRPPASDRPRTTPIDDAVDDARPEHRCARCGRPFADASLLALHRGLAHADDLAASERAAFERAYADESRALRRLRLRALIALVALYFGLLAVYALV